MSILIGLLEHSSVLPKHELRNGNHLQWIFQLREDTECYSRLCRQMLHPFGSVSPALPPPLHLIFINQSTTSLSVSANKFSYSLKYGVILVENQSSSPYLFRTSHSRSHSDYISDCASVVHCRIYTGGSQDVELSSVFACSTTSPLFIISSCTLMISIAPVFV